MAGYGRPLKGKTRRVPITVHAATGILEIIDECVEERNRQQEGVYSRSDFYDEAVKLYLEHLGRMPKDKQADRNNNRTKNVRKKSAEQNNSNNMNNRST